METIVALLLVAGPVDLLAPSGTDGGKDWPALQAPAVAAELKDSREKPLSLRLICSRYFEMAGTPTLADLPRFPPPEVQAQSQRFNEANAANLRVQRALQSQNAAWSGAALAEANSLRNAWVESRTAQDAGCW